MSGRTGSRSAGMEQLTGHSVAKIWRILVLVNLDGGLALFDEEGEEEHVLHGLGERVRIDDKV